MTAFEHLSSNQKIRAALHRDIQTIGRETCHFLGLEITKPAMDIVAELVFKKLSVYGADLEAFSKHAKRATINTEDVKLLVRRCPSLKSHLNTLAPPAAPISKDKKRKTISAARQIETPIAKAKEPEIQITKQKEPEIQTSKEESDIQAPILRQELEKVDDRIDKEENMSVNDLIDLTFD